MNTMFLLLAQYQKSIIPLEECCNLFGISEKKANEYAALNRLPIPTFRLADSQRAPIMVKVQDLAEWIDAKAAEAKCEWKKSQEY